MRILFLSICDPGDFSSGGNQRSNHMRDALLRLGEVDTIVVAQADASCVQAEWDGDRVMKVATAYAAGRSERRRQRRIARRLIAAADAANGYDVIVARYFRTATLVPRGAYPRLIVDGDDLRQTGAGQPLVRRLFVRARAAAIRLMARRLRHIWLIDPRDRAAVPGARASMLPNTARSMPAIASGGEGEAAAGRRIVMVGTYAYPPNEEGLVWFVRTILPRIVECFSDVTFHAIGPYYKRTLEALPGPVTMRGFVDDLAAEYRRATVVICPIVSGSGTQIKVVEALLHARPAVVSGFSYRGFADVLTPDEHLLVADDEAEWVQRIAAVLDRPGAFAAMADCGRDAAERAYSLDAFSRRIADTILVPGE